MKTEKRNSFGKKFGITVLCGLLCGLLTAGGLAGYAYYCHRKEQKSIDEAKNKMEAVQQKQEGSQVTEELTGLSENRESSVYDVSVVWDNVSPAMVVIDTKIVSSYATIFGQSYEQETEGSGSGVIIAQAEELYVVTNYHVIEGATAIQVTFVDGSTANATVKGGNAREDIAVISIPLSELSGETLQRIRTATIGDSNTLENGEMVIAIGNAAGGGQSLTVGYVSAVDRKVEFSGGSMNLIQTDAAINPGNSGGALLDASGALVGINNAKLVANDVEGVGYAIPISNVISLIHQLVNREEIALEDSAMLGIEGQEVTETLSVTLNIPVGVYIKGYTTQSPARDADIPLYSVITDVNGIGVTSLEQLKEVLRYIKGGSTGTVTVWERVDGEYVQKEYNVTFAVRGR